jgi:hypothetical protein
MSRYNSGMDDDGWGSTPGGSGSYNNSYGGGGGGRGGLDPWSVETQRINSNVSVISQNVLDIERMMARIDTYDDSEDLRAKMYVCLLARYLCVRESE